MPTVAEFGPPRVAAEIEQRPDYRSRRQQPVERESEPKGHNPKHEYEHRDEDHRDRENDEIDNEGGYPPRQNAVEQFGLGHWVVGVRFNVDRHGRFGLRTPWPSSIEMENKSALRKRLMINSGWKLAPALRHGGRSQRGSHGIEGHAC